MYHWEADQEGFLVLSGEGLLIVEGQERPLRQWDYVALSAPTRHMIVGAGDGPCVVLAVGARQHIDEELTTGALTSSTRLRVNTGPRVEKETSDPAPRLRSLSRALSRRDIATAGFRAVRSPVSVEIGVPSSASRSAHRTRFPSIATISTSCSPIGFGRSAERVLNTPRTDWRGRRADERAGRRRRARSSH